MGGRQEDPERAPDRRPLGHHEHADGGYLGETLEHLGVSREGHARVLGTDTEDGYKLGRWVIDQRNRKVRLSPERIFRLESLPEWTWNTRETAWEKGFSYLEKYVKREGHARVPLLHMEEDFNLGSWVRTQRRTGESLSNERVSRLEGLPEWTWDPDETAWEDGFSVLEKYAVREGHARVPSSHIEEEIRLGAWVNTQRNRKNRLALEQISRLESLPGWTWDALEAAWKDAFSVLEKYVKREGHARVPATYNEDGFNLGEWVRHQRSTKNRLTLEQISRLESLSEWAWTPRKTVWEEGFSCLEKYVKREGHAFVPRPHTEEGFKLGQWVTTQRCRKARLSPEQISRLESLPRWIWKPLETAWEEGFSALVKYAEREGHALVPRYHIEQGFKLGQWVKVQRRDKNRSLTERRARLESLPGWSWNARGTS